MENGEAEMYQVFFDSIYLTHKSKNYLLRFSLASDMPLTAPVDGFFIHRHRHACETDSDMQGSVA